MNGSQGSTAKSGNGITIISSSQRLCHSSLVIISENKVKASLMLEFTEDRFVFFSLFFFFFFYFKNKKYCFLIQWTSGLIVSHTVINSAVVEVFIDYLTTAWKKDPSKNPILEEAYLPTAATIVNLQDGISTVSAVVVAYIADSYLNCFTTIVICALTYTMVIPHSFLV